MICPSHPLLEHIGPGQVPQARDADHICTSSMYKLQAALDDLIERAGHHSGRVQCEDRVQNVDRVSQGSRRIPM